MNSHPVLRIFGEIFRLPYQYYYRRLNPKKTQPGQLQTAQDLGFWLPEFASVSWITGAAVFGYTFLTKGQSPRTHGRDGRKEQILNGNRTRGTGRR